MKGPFQGSLVALPTPFRDGRVDYPALRRLIEFQLEGKSDGLILAGSTGEGVTLTARERLSVIEYGAGVADGRVPVVAGVGSSDTRVACELALAAERAGADGLLASTPAYNKPQQRGLVAHFGAVAEVSSLPLVLYNIPGRTGRVLETAGMLELAKTPNIAGVKQSVDDIGIPTLELLAGAPRDFAVLGGDDYLLLPLTYLGGVGAICASAHVCMERFVAEFECGVAGKVEEGRAHHEALLPVVQACFAEPNPSVFKAALHAQGRIPTPDVRLPLVNASDAARDRALEAIAAAQG